MSVFFTVRRALGTNFQVYSEKAIKPGLPATTTRGSHFKVESAYLCRP